MALRVRRSSQNQLTQSARLSRLSSATSSGGSWLPSSTSTTAGSVWRSALAMRSCRPTRRSRFNSPP